MSIKIDRFEAIDVGKQGESKIGINDRLNNRIVAVVNVHKDKKKQLKTDNYGKNQHPKL